MKTRYFLPVVLALAAVVFSACSKTPQAPEPPPGYGNRILFLLKDNFSLENIYRVVQSVRMGDTLQVEQPLTFVAISNQAGYNMFWDWMPYADKRNIVRYLTLRGAHAFRQLPLTENLPLQTSAGTNMYITRYMRGNDTVTAVNGSELVAIDNPASNGYLQVLRENINMEKETTVLRSILNDTTVTLFAAALQRAGLTDSLADAAKTWTVLAPVNTAFLWSAGELEGLDVSTIDKILSADPEKLKNVLRYHLAAGRNFTGNLYRLAAAASGNITMLNGGSVRVGGNQAMFNNITFRGRLNGTAVQIATFPSAAANPNYANIPCGNGVIHKITRVLIP